MRHRTFAKPAIDPRNVRECAPSHKLSPRQPARGRVVFLLLWIVLAAAIPAALASDEIAVTVTSTQTVTLHGRGPSLRTVVEDVCYRAGIDVLFWDAGDRPFGGTYDDVPVEALLARLLSQESYLLEVAQYGPTTRVTSLRVLGDPAVAALRRASGSTRRRRSFAPPYEMIRAAFGQPETGSDKQNDQPKEDQKAALAMLASSIAGSPERLKGFLATEPKLIAQAIQRFQGVEGPLREIQAKYPDPVIRQKIDAIIAALAALPPPAQAPQ